MTARHRPSNHGRSAEPATDRRLVLRAQPAHPLNRKQQTFNRLVAAIEKLRATLNADTRRFDEALAFHAEHLRPLIRRVSGLRMDVVRALRPYLDDSRLKTPSRLELRAIVVAQLDDVLANEGALDDDLLALFEQIHGASLESLEREQMDEARSAMEGLFADMGLDVDLSDFHPGMSEEERAVKSAGMIEDLRRQAEEAWSRREAHGARGKKKSKRALKEEERARRSEELHKNTLGAIYRQLAKVLHPDLERDPDVRERKNAVMQNLTAAYAAGDLHALLRLELEWIHRETAGSALLADEKLDAYNELLEEQVTELQATLDALPLSPRYAPLVRDAGPWGTVFRLDGAAEVERLNDLTLGLTGSLERLQTRDALREVRDAIRSHRQVRRMR